jgi:formylglycine-generating enzyme required for sulfatase activity
MRNTTIHKPLTSLLVFAFLILIGSSVSGEEPKVANQSKTITFSVKDQNFDMILIPKGQTVIGQPFPTTINEDFYIGETEVTQSIYEVVMGNNPSNPIGGNLPINKVSLSDAVKFTGKISSLLGKKFRLPTSTEWEYACQSKKTSKFYWGDKFLRKYVRHPESSGKLEFVKSNSPNDYGLFGMADNVSEWSDPEGKIKKGYTYYKVKGGNYNGYMEMEFMCAHSFQRYSFNKTPIIGFRLALDITNP